MKKFLFLYIAASFVLTACSEDEIKTYDAKDFIYYSNRYVNQTVYWDTMTTFNFFFTPGLMDTLIQIEVTSGGIVPDRDRVFLVDVQATGGAVSGVDYEVDEQQIMPAGSNTGYVKVKLNKTDKLEGNTYSLKVNLKENENFGLDLPVVYHNGDTIQRTSWKIDYLAELAEPPFYATLRGRYLGYWSILKFNTMNELLGLTIDDWTDTNSQFYKNDRNYCIVFGNYLNRKIAEGPDAAIKDPDAKSERGYMTITGFAYFGVPPTVVPADFPTTPEWEGK